MIVFRLTLPKYANDLTGTGAALFGGRWNSIGNFMLYTAQTSSLSILEHLVHITGAESIQYVLTEIEVNDDLVQKLKVSLSPRWQTNEKETAMIGDEWIKSLRSSILRVPSVINPLEYNFLINPNHQELKIEIVSQEWFVYDRRLIKR